MDSDTRTRDGWLALRCQSGEPRAFEDLVRTMEAPLRYYAGSLAGQASALDVLQEAWIIAFRGLRRLHDPEALRPWLYRIVHGIAVDRIRRDAARQRAEEVHRDGLPENEPPTFAAHEAAAIHRALDSLSTEHRDVLVLHFLEDFSLAEIAGIVRCPEGTVKSRLHHAKKAMKALLTQGDV